MLSYFEKNLDFRYNEQRRKSLENEIDRQISAWPNFYFIIVNSRFEIFDQNKIANTNLVSLIYSYPDIYINTREFLIIIGEYGIQLITNSNINITFDVENKIVEYMGLQHLDIYPLYIGLLYDKLNWSENSVLVYSKQDILDLVQEYL